MANSMFKETMYAYLRLMADSAAEVDEARRVLIDVVATAKAANPEKFAAVRVVVNDSRKGIKGDWIAYCCVLTPNSDEVTPESETVTQL